MRAELARGNRQFTFTLILSGGNAPGAFEAGAYEALHEAGLEPDWVIGASIGAIDGAIIAGNRPELRLAKLAELWQPASEEPSLRLWEPFETMRRSAAANWAIATGQPGIFGPLISGLGGPSVDFGKAGRALFDTSRLDATLKRLVDFDLLNEGGVRFTVGAVDVESSDEVIFDNRSTAIGSDHVRASAALPVAFPPVEIDGRWLVDGGLAANLPLDPFFAAPPAGPSLCIAVDLLPLHATRPATIGEAARRMQDIVFAAQSRRTIARWSDHYRQRQAEGGPAITFTRLAYDDQASEVAGKAMDFSPVSVGERWRAGYAKMQRFIETLNVSALNQPGLRELSATGDLL